VRATKRRSARAWIHRRRSVLSDEGAMEDSPSVSTQARSDARPSVRGGGPPSASAPHGLPAARPGRPPRAPGPAPSQLNERPKRGVVRRGRPRGPIHDPTGVRTGWERGGQRRRETQAPRLTRELPPDQGIARPAETTRERRHLLLIPRSKVRILHGPFARLPGTSHDHMCDVRTFARRFAGPVTPRARGRARDHPFATRRSGYGARSSATSTVVPAGAGGPL
jgi:hypothetical protein